MATYKEFEKFVKSQYGAVAPEDAPPGFTAIKIPFADGRSQIVFFTKSDTSKLGENVAVISLVGQVKGAKLVEALTHAFDLGIGGLVIVNGELALSHTILLENVDENEIALPLFSIAVTADEFEKKYVGGDEK